MECAASNCNTPVHFYKIQDVRKHNLEILHLVIIDSDLPCKVTVHGHEVSREVCTALFDIPNTIDDC